MPLFRGMYFAAIAQQVERILGKDEVPSSNLGSSSTRKPLVSAVFRDFSFSAHFAANRKRIEQRIELDKKQRQSMKKPPRFAGGS